MEESDEKLNQHGEKETQRNACAAVLEKHQVVSDEVADQYMASRVLIGVGAVGHLVRQMQRALIASGCEVKADGVYGQGTWEAVRAFQARKSLEVSGSVEETTWRALLGRSTPSVGERCLQLTAAFEGHGFELAMGDFDGALLTWGIVGFTMKSGEVQKVVRAIEEAKPELVRQAFGDRREELLRVMSAGHEIQKEWARRNTAGNGLLGEPWRTMFANFGAMAEVQAEQMLRVREDYLEPAIRTAKKLGFRSELGLALCFDVHVQNGGIGTGIRKSMQQKFQAGMAELERRKAVANLVADGLGEKWKEDVRARKLTIATGVGEVHGKKYVLENWGLSGEIAATELIQDSGQAASAKGAGAR